MGNMPISMASAVINTGRKRLKPASSAAISGAMPRASDSRAELMTRMLLAVAMPIHRIVPVSAGTLSVVCVTNSIHAIPAIDAGRPLMMMKGSTHDWKFTTINRYTSAIAKTMPSASPLNDAFIDCTCPRIVIDEPAGRCACAAFTRRPTSAATPPRSRPCVEAKMSSTGCTL